ncbi:MAG: helix-turn-helix domain-containing protein [Acetatifactor sp.]
MKNNLGANIKYFKKNKGYTQEELAGILGVTPQAVSRWESETGLPDVSMIVPITQALCITTDALLGYDARSQDDMITKKIFDRMVEFEDVSNPGRSKLRGCEYLAEEANKNPMNYDVVLKYVQNVAGLSYYIDMEGLLSNEPERAKTILEDGIRKGINVIRYSYSLFGVLHRLLLQTIELCFDHNGWNRVLFFQMIFGILIEYGKNYKIR